MSQQPASEHQHQTAAALREYDAQRALWDGWSQLYAAGLMRRSDIAAAQRTLDRMRVAVERLHAIYTAHLAAIEPTLPE